jgi:hypothetical protein
MAGMGNQTTQEFTGQLISRQLSKTTWQDIANSIVVPAAKTVLDAEIKDTWAKLARATELGFTKWAIVSDGRYDSQKSANWSTVTFAVMPYPELAIRHPVATLFVFVDAIIAVLPFVGVVPATFQHHHASHPGAWSRRRCFNSERISGYQELPGDLEGQEGQHSYNAT